MSPHVLLVDDDPLLRHQLIDLLSDEGYTVREVADGAAALVACQGPLPDLILMDLDMPGLTGPDTCRRLKADPRTRGVPVIFISGASDWHDRLACFESGGVDYVAKPFQPAEVRARVRAHLEISVKTRALAEVNRTLLDLNERIQLSENRKNDFLGSLGRQIDRPLGTLASLGARVAEGGLDGAGLHAVGTRIQVEALGLDLQLETLFLAGDLEAGSRFPMVTRFAPAVLLAELAAAWSVAARSRGVALEVQAAEGAFETDEGLLRLALANLLQRALRSSPEGSTVTLTWQPVAGGGLVKVQASAAGPSVPPVSDRELDLEVVASVLDLLGGQLNPERLDPEAGSTTCFLPALPVDPEATPRLPEAARALPPEPPWT